MMDIFAAAAASTSGLLALAVALLFAYLNLRQPEGNKRMVEIASAIRSGATTYMKRQYATIWIIALIVAVLLAVFLGIPTAASFILGALCSTLAGVIGMMMAVKSNVRTANAAVKGLGPALSVAFRGGAVMGLSVVGLGAIGISLIYFIFNGDVSPIIGFSFGASLVALFARVGGGIFTKGADVGADLVGKVEKGIPEDDPRNPAVVADNVGDNVGDCAGMGADLFESYAGAIISSMVLGFAVLGYIGAAFPLLVAAAGILASLLGAFFVRAESNPQKALNYGTYISYVLAAILLYLVSTWMVPGEQGLNLFYAALFGLVAGLIIGWTAEYYTSEEYRPVKDIARSAQTGTGTLLISGFGESMMSVVPPVLIVCIAILLAFKFAGMFGIAIAGLGMLTITGIVVAADAYGPISDNAGGIAQMSGLGPNVRKITDSLDSVGNTVKALTKGFAIGSAALTALALISAFYQEAKLQVADLTNPVVLAGIMLGAMLPFMFSSLCMRGVGRTAFDVVEEVRRQWREIKGLSTGRAKADYAKCVDICTRSALRELIAPGLLAISTPIFVGFLLGPAALAGVLAGATASGFALAILMANSGGAWDNAKKYIETGMFGGKGSEAHKAAVVGDTLGDPFKDTAGPALNILIKLMSIVSLVLAPLFTEYALNLI